MQKELKKRLLHTLKRISTAARLLQQECDTLHEDMIAEENSDKKESDND